MIARLGSILLCGLLLLSGCGIQHSIDQSNDKQDQLLTQIKQSNAKQDDLLNQIKESNDKQEGLLGQIKTSNEKLDKVIEVTKHLGDLEVQLIQGIDVTNGGVHLQILVGALHEMLSPQNDTDIIIPARMMPYADTFGKEATAEELVKEFKTLYIDVQQGATDTQRVQDRQISYTVSWTIAGMAPQDKVEQIIATQIDQQGEYQDAAYPFAAARYSFLKDVLLADTMSADKPSVATLQRAVDYVRAMKYLANRPDAANMVWTFDPQLGLTNLSVDQTSLHDAMKKAYNYFKTIPQQDTTVQSLLAELQS